MAKQSAVFPDSMPADEVLSVLKKKGVVNLYHANTVRTSIIILKQCGLLSREQSEKLGHTRQYSDSDDKRLGLWDKIFIDPLDIHTDLKRNNLYGPITFVLDLNILTSVAIKKIRASYKNPTKWKDTDKLEDKWFVDATDIEQRSGIIGCSYSIILTCDKGVLPFENFLTNIILDNPNQIMPETQDDTYAYVNEQLSTNLGDLTVLIDPRVCPTSCTCTEEYEKIAMKKEIPKDFKRLFHPVPSERGI